MFAAAFTIVLYSGGLLKNPPTPVWVWDACLMFTRPCLVVMANLLLVLAAGSKTDYDGFLIKPRWALCCWCFN